MILAGINHPRNCLHLSFVGSVSPEEIRREAESLPGLLAGLDPDFTLMVDLERLDHMPKECAPEIGRLMEMFDKKAVAQVIRIISDRTKDIGFQVLALLHYKVQPPVMVCESLGDACEFLPDARKIPRKRRRAQTATGR